MADDFYSGIYNPDVLSCIANLSNDEVFTPPEIANQVLDMLPQELFLSPDTKFLDPACKSGVFLREIAKRLIKGLEPQIPELQQRIDHIFQHQLYGIAITELTSLLSRRGVYCSKYPNSIYSVSPFTDAQGNIRFKRIQHQWKNGSCAFCGASQDQYDRDVALETHAYELIHTTRPEEIFKMKFDVIIGNPPYQLSVGNLSGNSSKARAIYHGFVTQAMKLNPRFLSMIIPSRWMTRSTEGIPDEWVDLMLLDDRFRVFHDYLDASDVFPGVEIKGGVCFFLWDRDYSGKCAYYSHGVGNQEPLLNVDYLNSKKAGIVIRDMKSLTILDKIEKVEGQYFTDEKNTFISLVSPKDYFTNKVLLTSSWKGYSTTRDNLHSVKYYLNKNIHKCAFGWISKKDVPKHVQSIPIGKVYIPAAGGSGTDSQILGKPFYGEPNSVCSQTYLVIGYDPEKHNFSKEECLNIITYIKTRFFRYLVSIKKKTQNGPRQVYQFVPLQDFSKPWTDDELYKKYSLLEEEIDYIEEIITPLDQGADTNGD